MTLNELKEYASRLPLNAPDMIGNDDRHFSALSSYSGKLSAVCGRLAEAPGDALLTGEAMSYCGASILAIASIAAGLGIDLDEAIPMGERELLGNGNPEA